MENHHSNIYKRAVFHSHVTLLDVTHDVVAWTLIFHAFLPLDPLFDAYVETRIFHHVNNAWSALSIASRRRTALAITGPMIQGPPFWPASS